MIVTGIRSFVVWGALALTGTGLAAATVMACSDDKTEATATDAGADVATVDASDGALPTGLVTGTVTYNGAVVVKADQPGLNVAVLKKYPPGPEGPEIMGLSFLPAPVFPGTVTYSDPGVDIGTGVAVAWWGEVSRPGYEFPRPEDPIGFAPVTVTTGTNAPFAITLEAAGEPTDAGSDAADGGDGGDGG